MPVDIFAFLDEHAIGYERTDHEPVFTFEQAERLVPPMDGVDTKNLFIRDKKGRRHFLVIVGYDKSVDLKALARHLGTSGLSFASAERLSRHLGVDPGSVSLLSIVNDRNGSVEVVVDTEIWRAERWKCHPLVNTSTLSIAGDDIRRILRITSHDVRIIEVPGRN